MPATAPDTCTAMSEYGFELGVFSTSGATCWRSKLRALSHSAGVGSRSKNPRYWIGKSPRSSMVSAWTWRCARPRMLSSTFARLVSSRVSRNGVHSHIGAPAGTRARSASYFCSRAVSASFTALRISDNGWINRQIAIIAMGSAPRAMAATRVRPSKARKHQITTSGGTEAGMTSGQRCGDRCARASKSAAAIAAKPEAGTMTSAAAFAAFGAAPLTQATTVRTVSNDHNAMIWIAA